VLGGLLAITASRSLQLHAARLTVLFALGFDLLFFAVNELPATVPVALTLILLAARQRRVARQETGPADRSSARDSAPHDRALQTAGPRGPLSRE